MQKIIRNYEEGGFKENFRNIYTKWKFGKPKHRYYVQGRRSNLPVLDDYDWYILNNLIPGKTIAYDTAGYYLDSVIDDLVVVELNPIVLRWYPKAIINTSPEVLLPYYGTADNFIINNTIKLRWKTFDDYTNFWLAQQVFFKPGTQIFFSFRDIFIFHNRLKYKFSDLLAQWLSSMEKHGFSLIRLTHDLIQVTDHMNKLDNIPEINDMVNGNIKIHWRYQ